MIKIDEEKIFSTIENRKPKRVVFQAPDGILRQTSEVASKVQDKYGINTFILADPNYGICDTAEGDIKILGADLAFHIGHTVSVGRMGTSTVLVDAFDDVSFDAVLEKARPLLNHKRIGICTSSQHVEQVEKVRETLREYGLEVHVGKGKGLLRDGHVFGCEFYPAFNIKDSVDIYLHLGQSRFHALGVALSTGKPTLMLDPYLNEAVDMSDLADERLKRAILSVYKAKEAENFGIIIGLREGQLMTKRGIDLQAELERRGKNVRLIALRDVTEERLAMFPDTEAFVQTACPRISIDGYTFSKTVLSAPQADALLRLLDGEDIGDLLVQKHWL